MTRSYYHPLVGWSKDTVLLEFRALGYRKEGGTVVEIPGEAGGAVGAPA